MMKTEKQLEDTINKAITEGAELDHISHLLDEWSGLSASSDLEFLVLACKTSSISTIKLLLSRGFIVTVKAVIAACHACRASYNFDILQAFLDSGWDINTSFGHVGDFVMLSLASPPFLLKWVLDHGADPNRHRDGLRYTALDYAIVGNSIEQAELLITHGAHINNTGALGRAASKGRIEMIQLLLEKGADINEIPGPESSLPRTVLGTALHKAAENGQIAAVQLLLEKGADSSLKDTAGKTALELAKENNHMAVVRVLECKMSMHQPC